VQIVETKSRGPTVGEERDRLLRVYGTLPWWLRLRHWRTERRLRRMKMNPTKLLAIRGLIVTQIRRP